MRVQFENLTVEKQGRLARITFHRTQRLNAFHYPGVRDLDAAAKLVSDDSDLRVVALVGEGRAFSTGIDLKELAAGNIDERYFHAWDSAVRQFETMDKLAICLMHGFAYGGGLQLGLACDLRIGTPKAKYALPAVKEGLIPGLGTQRLGRYIGLGRAKAMSLWGDVMEGEEGYRTGLVDALVADDKPHEQFEPYIEKTLAMASQGARYTKHCLAMMSDLDWQEAFDLYMELQRKGLSSADFREAMDAYQANRMPKWG
jgi:enoyl-CoA hydratase/carnithine racemase